MKVLLAIKPEFAERILDGSKKFEFRKTIFKSENIKVVLIYASSPVQKVVGEFEIEKVIVSEPEILWRKTKKYSGITKEYFDSYFTDKEKGFAIKIKNLKKYRKPKCLKADYNISSPPQSFLYLSKQNKKRKQTPTLIPSFQE
jgi:predicted transcriptional regulator